MTRQRAGAALLVLLVTLFAAAPVVGPNDPRQQFPDHAFAPPMRPRLVHDGGIRPPFIYPVRVTDRRERQFEQDSRPVPIEFLANGRLATTDPSSPWLLLGGDPLGRDVFSRVLNGGRLSLGVATIAVALALAIGALLGAAAGFAGGRTDRFITGLADFTIVVPMIYAVVTLRAVMPLAPAPSTIFWTMAIVMALATWPLPARGVRAIIAAERRTAYAEAAYAAGAGPLRILLRHLLPAAAGHVAIQGFLLFPAFIFTEATLSFVGLGFAEPASSWGVMLQDAARLSAMTDAPWLLAPAAAIVVTVVAARMLAGDRAGLAPSAKG